MGFSGWGRRCELVIQSSQVAQDCVDFPVLIHQDNLPSEIFDANGSYPALNGGGDLRFSSDQDGNSQIPCEVEQFVTDNDPANGKAAIYVKRTISSAANTPIWVYYNKSGEVQPSETNPYGKHAVWDSNYKMVQHMNQDPSGSAPQMIDSTSNSNDGTSYGAMTSTDLVNGVIGKAIDFEGTDDIIQFPNTSELQLNSNFSIEFFLQMGAGGHGTYPGFFDKGNWTSNAADNGWGVYANRSGPTLTFIKNNQSFYFSVISTSTFTHLVATYDSSDVCRYKDGSLYGTSSGITFVVDTNTEDLLLGRSPGGNFGAMLFDEFRISNTNRSANWILTGYNNQNSPATFIIEGTPEDVGVAIPSAPLNIQASDGTYTDKVRITWSASSGATSYEVYRSDTEISSKTLKGSPATTTFDDETAVAYTVYYYWIKAVNSAGSSDYSAYNTGWRIIGVRSWPSTLPSPQKKIGLTPGDQIKERRLQSGRTESRRFGDGKPDEIKVIFRLLWSQIETFKTFYESDLNLGCNWFTASWVTTLGYNDHMAKFIGYPREVGRQGYYVDIVCTLMIQLTAWTTSDSTWGTLPDPVPPPPIYSGYIYGGNDGATSLFDCDCLYNGETWSSKTNLPALRTLLAASTIGNNGYIYGGTAKLRDCTQYQYSSDIWTVMSDMPTPGRGYLAASTIGNSGYIYAGFWYQYTTYDYLNDCDEYTPDVWVSKTSYDSDRRALAASTINNSGYIYGGRNALHAFQDCDEYTPDVWVSKSDMPSPARYHFAASTIAGYGYVYSGRGPSSYLQDCDRYDPNTNTWTSMTNTPLPARQSLAASTMGVSSYIYGGYNGPGSHLQDCDKYLPDLWTSIDNIPTPGRYDLAASSI